jgi:hypothetical protein
MTTLSLYKHHGTPMTSYLKHRYPGGNLYFYPARVSNFSYFSLLIESRILTVIQKKNWLLKLEVGDQCTDITLPYYHQLHIELYACVCSRLLLHLTLYITGM